MTTTRRIARTFVSQPTLEGAGVRLHRAFGFAEAPLFDPFLMLDDFSSERPEDYLAGFPWHPHRGIETITMVFAGLIEHGDSLGNSGAIGDGEVQWMTAGSGIIHQEMPRRTADGVLQGLQLWANLPAADKMMAPRYRDLAASAIAEVALAGGGRVRVIAGELAGVRGPVDDIVIDPTLAVVELPAGAVFTHALPAGHAVFAYVLSGAGSFEEDEDSRPHGAGTTVLYERAGEMVRIAATAGGLRLLLAAGRPLGEPVAWRGPIVMNTEEELRQAFAAYNDGTFLDHRPSRS